MMNVSTLINRLKSSQLFKDSFWALVGSTLGKGLSLLSGVVVARFLGSEIYGEYSLVRSTLLYISIFSTLGLGYSATKYVAEYIKSDKTRIKSLINKVTNITFLVSITLALLQFIFADTIANFISAPHLNKIIRSFSFLIIFNAITTSQIAILAGLKEFRKTAIINTYSGILTFICSAILTYFYGLNGALTSLAIAYTYQCIISKIEIDRCLKAEYSTANISSNEVKEIIKFSIPLALQDGLYSVTHWLSWYLLIQFSSYIEMGISSAAGIWQTIIVFVPAMLKNVMFSHFSSTDNHRSLVKKMLFINLITSSIPCFLILLLLNPISSFYGESYIGLPNVIIVSVIGGIFICLGEVFTYEIISKGRTWLVFSCRLIRDLSALIALYITLLHITANQALLYGIVSQTSHILYLIIIYWVYKETDYA